MNRNSGKKHQFAKTNKEVAKKRKLYGQELEAFKNVIETVCENLEQDYGIKELKEIKGEPGNREVFYNGKLPTGRKIRINFSANTPDFSANMTDTAVNALVENMMTKAVKDAGSPEKIEHREHGLPSEMRKRIMGQNIFGTSPAGGPTLA